jgi:hypothetical protein
VKHCRIKLEFAPRDMCDRMTNRGITFTWHRGEATGFPTDEDEEEAHVWPCDRHRRHPPRNPPAPRCGSAPCTSCSSADSRRRRPRRWPPREAAPGSTYARSRVASCRRRLGRRRGSAPRKCDCDGATALVTMISLRP